MAPLRILVLVALLALARGAALSGASTRQVLTICEAGLPCPPNFVCSASNLCVPAPSPSPSSSPIASQVPVVALSIPAVSPYTLPMYGVTPEPSGPGVTTYPTMMPSMEPSAPPLPVTQVLPPPVVGTPPPTPSPLPSPTRMPNAFGRLECAACTDASQCATGGCHVGKCVYTDYRFRGSVLKCFGAMGVP